MTGLQNINTESLVTFAVSLKAPILAFGVWYLDFDLGRNQWVFLRRLGSFQEAG